jgi:hypothetical protein
MQALAMGTFAGDWFRKRVRRTFAAHGRACAGIGAFAAFVAMAGEALAHASDRGHVLLLPTGYYAVGGALAVSLSFVLLAFVPPQPLDRLVRAKVRLGRMPDLRVVTSLVSFAGFAGLIWAGFHGSRDPLSNPLPLVFWTLIWIGLVLMQGLVGNLWSWIDPWRGPCRVAAIMLGRKGEGGFLPYPRRLGYWPAVAGFFGFAWFELVHAAPDDPARLASVLAAYWAATFLAMLAFGHAAWSRQGEFLTVFMRMVSRMAVLGRETSGPAIATARLPGARLAEQNPLPPSGTIFLLLALSSVSFDGLMRTFFWFGLNGLNPLEFPGRSAVVGINTAGLLGMFALLAVAFLGAVWLGERLAGRRAGFWQAAGALVWSIMPISLAYHFSHYLGSLLLNGQYALAALSDPLSRGWNLFGTAGLHVSAGVTAGAEAAWVMWNFQAFAIILGHVLAIVAAHVVAWRRHGDARRAAISQIPLAALMVGYTVFGLWLLSTPTGN